MIDETVDELDRDTLWYIKDHLEEEGIISKVSMF